MSVEIGRQAETLAVEYLLELGYRITDRNWRNRWCEIDIVAESDQGVHFIEVKYRRYNTYGSPAECITRDKAKRLRRAANAWCLYHHYQGAYQIDVISLEGDLSKPRISHIPSAVE